MTGLDRFVDAPSGLAEAGRLPPLRRFRRPREATEGALCEFCTAPIGDEHRHVVDLDQRGMACACRGCGLLFTDTGAAQGRYRTVPDRYLRIHPFTLTPSQWAALDIPVGVAFVVRNSRLGETVAFYPSPGGATESELPLVAWGDIVVANPALDDVASDVEAVLVRPAHTARGRSGEAGDGTECYVVPVDRCYELVGRLRLTWRGFDGGQQARAAVAEFFADVATKARVTP